jgi:hypothetical protein
MSGGETPSLPPWEAPRETVRPGPFWSYQDLVLLVGLALPVMVVSALAVQVVSWMLPGGAMLPAVGVLAAQFLAYAAWFLVLWAIIRLRYGRPFWHSLAWIQPGRGILRYALFGPLLAISVGIAGALLRTPDIELPMMELMRDRLSLILVGAFAVSLGPLCEELAFRGFFLPLLARSIGAAAAVLATSAVFALLHGPQYAWSWRHLVLITAAGAAFGVVRLRTGSTSAATVMHATYNLTLFMGYLTHLEQIGAPW